MPGILNEAVPATTQNVDSEIQRTVRDAYKYTGLVEKICYNEREEPPHGLSLQLLKEALINSRQHEAFLRVLLVSCQHKSNKINSYYQLMSIREAELWVSGVYDSPYNSGV